MPINLNLIRGDTYKVRLTFYQNNENYDLYGHKVYLTVKTAPGQTDDEAVIKKDYQISEHTNYLDITLSPQDTDLLTAPKYVFDIQIKTPEADIYTPVIGNINITYDITRRSS